MKRSMTIKREAHDSLPGETATINSYIVSSYYIKNAQAVEISHQFANTQKLFFKVKCKKKRSIGKILPSSQTNLSALYFEIHSTFGTGTDERGKTYDALAHTGTEIRHSTCTGICVLCRYRLSSISSSSQTVENSRIQEEIGIKFIETHENLMNVE